MTPSELLTLIASDAQATAYFQAGNDEACAARCTAIAPPVRQPVPARVVRLRAMALGMYAVIKIASEDKSLPNPPRGLAVNFITLVDSTDTIDLDNPEIQSQADLLRQYNLASAEQIASIQSLANTPQIITFHDVGAARQAGVTANGVA